MKFWHVACSQASRENSRFKVSASASTQHPQVHGPFTANDILEFLKSGDLTYLDFAFESGGEADNTHSSWRLISQVPEFAPCLHADKSTWAIAKQSNGQTSLEGPFSTSEVLDQIACGQVRFSDLAWRAGQASWVRIGDHPSFDRKTGDREIRNSFMEKPRVSAQVIEASKEDLLASVVRMRKLGWGEEAAPDEADGDDLTLSGWYTKLLSVLFIAAVGVSQPAQTFAANEAAPDNRTISSANVGTISLEILALKLTSDQPALVFQTNAPQNALLKVMVEGRSGEILNVPSYLKTFEVKRESGELPTLSLKGLPNGTYQITAEFGTSRVTKTIFIGERSLDFDTSLQAHQKMISEQQQEERNALFYSSRSAEKLARNLAVSYKKNRKKPAIWKADFQKWRKDLREVQAPFEELFKRAEMNFAYPLAVTQMKEALNRLNERAAAFDSSVDQKRELASEEKLETPFTEIKKSAIALSSVPAQL